MNCDHPEKWKRAGDICLLCVLIENPNSNPFMLREAIASVALSKDPECQTYTVESEDD